MKAKFLLQIFCISILLLCFLASSQGTPSLDRQNVLNVPNIPGKAKVFTLPMTHQENPRIFDQYGVSIQFSESNIPLDVSVNMRSSGLWVNNCTQWRSNGFNFHCEASQTCQSKGPAQYTWVEEVGWERPQISISGTLVKETVSLGSVVLPDADVLLANEISYSAIEERIKGTLGLNFRRSHPDVPTFFEYLKTEGFVDKSILSVYLDRSSNNGELVFGGLDSKRAESEFQYAKWQEDEDLELPGFSLQAKIGYGDKVLAEEYKVVIDFDQPNIIVPKWISDKVYQEEYARGLNVVTETCKAIPFLQDVVLEFEGMTLRIPPAAYMRYGDVVYYDSHYEEEKGYNSNCEDDYPSSGAKEIHVKSCQDYFYSPEEEGAKPIIILGRPFLKFFYTVFNLEQKTVGFSKMTSLMKEYPFSEPAGDYPVLHYYLPLKVGGLLAVLAIGKFCIIFYFIKRAWKAPEAASSPSENLVSPKIDVRKHQYSVANDGDQQESHHIDVGKVTIEEEKFYA